MTVLFYCSFNDTTKDQVSLSSGSPSKTVTAAHFTPFLNGKRGCLFTAADLRVIAYPLTITNIRNIAFGFKIKTTSAFEAATAVNRTILTLAHNTSYTTNAYKAGFAVSGDYFYVNALNTAVGGSINLALLTFLTAANDEITVGYQACPDPDDPTSDNMFCRLYINGYCVASEHQPITDFPSDAFNYLWVGGKAGAVGEDLEGAVRDLWVMDTSATGPLQDYQFLRIHREDFNPSAITDSSVYHDNYQVANYGRQTLDYSVESVNNDRLWSHSGTQVYYTDDPTGASGWTAFGAAVAATIRSVYAVGLYVFVSTADTIYRAQIASPGWSSVLTLTTDAYILPGAWGWTHYTATVGNVTHLVCGEYAGAGNGRKIYHSTDFGTNWTAVYTCGANTIEHIHGVLYTDGGRLWACRGDTVDNIGYSDDHGSNWTWLLNEADHGEGGQFIGFAETPDKIITGIDSTDSGSVCMAFAKDLNAVMSQYSNAGWNNAFYHVGQAGGLYSAPGWTIVALPNDFVLIYQFYHNAAGQHSSVYVTDRTGTVCIRAEDLGAEVAIPKDQTASAVSSERAFIGNMAFPLNVHIRGGSLFRHDQYFMLPKKRKYALAE